MVRGTDSGCFWFSTLFFVRFVLLCFALFRFPSFSFSFSFFWFFSFYFLSVCVSLVLSRFGGAFVVSFVLTFVSVGVLHLATCIHQPTLFDFISVGAPLVVCGFSLAALELRLGVGWWLLVRFLFAVRCCVYGLICS